MTAATLWLPASSCGPHCLPSDEAVPRVGPAAVLGRRTAVAAVLLFALLVLPAIALSGPRGRARLTRGLARALLSALGVRHRTSGRVPQRGALLVANHVSWLDVLVLLAYAPVRLLAKREVRGWPVIGALAAAMGTVFIDRTRPMSLPWTVADVADALRGGGVVAVFPEGTTWCGRTGGTFRPAMFQ